MISYVHLLIAASVLGSLTPDLSRADSNFGFIDRFDTLAAKRWYAADYDWDHPLFDTDWKASHATANNGLTLVLRPSSGVGNGFHGASIRRRSRSGFGRYSAQLKPAKGAGLVTGFFTYTGPVFKTLHNEIDMEILGQDTTRINLAVFTDGVKWDRRYDLGFDAAKTSHLFAFDWTPSEIRWFVDDVLIARYDKTQGRVPQTPSYIYSDIWAADHRIASWAGRSAPDLAGQSIITCLSHTPLDVPKDTKYDDCLSPTY